jgi:hypothetical protein
MPEIGTVTWKHLVNQSHDKVSIEKLQIAEWVNSETDFGGTVCVKSARTGLWGSGEVTNRSTRKTRHHLYAQRETPSKAV